MHAEHHDHKKLTAAEREKYSAEYQEEAKIFEQLKAEHGKGSKDHWSLQEELQAVHNEYLAHKAEYKDEADMFVRLQDAHGEFSKAHLTLAEELAQLHSEHHDHKKLTSAELAQMSSEYSDEAKMYERIKVEHGAKSKDHWTVSEELQALHTEYAAHKEKHKDDLEKAKMKMAPEKIAVSIISARSLAKHDLFSDSDPFVVCQLEDQTFDTHEITDNHNPVWNFGPRTINYQSELQFIVYDKDPEGKDFIGKAVLPREKFRAEGWEGELPLKDMKGQPVQGFLTVKVAHA